MGKKKSFLQKQNTGLKSYQSCQDLLELLEIKWSVWFYLAMKEYKIQGKAEVWHDKTFTKWFPFFHSALHEGEKETPWMKEKEKNPQIMTFLSDLSARPLFRS